MKRILALLIIMLCIIQLQAQHYKNSSGLRMGYTSALTYKHFLNREQAVEFLVSGRNEGFQVTTLYQFNKPLDVSFNDNFYLFYGVGAHVGYERISDVVILGPINPPFPPEVQVDETAYFTMGVNTILGVEYRWLAVPLTIGLDIKPYLDFIGMRYTETRFWDTAITVKYVF